MATCKNCNKEFEPNSKKQMFCCAYCRLASHRKGKERKVREAVRATCAVCGAAYKPDRSSMYCSNACKQGAYRKRKEKPFLLECFRLPADECHQDNESYLNSIIYLNGIGLDRWVELMLEAPGIRDKVRIVKYSRHERLGRQELYFKDLSEKGHRDNNDPFVVMSGGDHNVYMPMCIGDRMMFAIQTNVILEYIGVDVSDVSTYGRR